MMYSEEQYENLKASGKILRDTLKMIAKEIRAGVSTLELDSICEKFILERGGEPSFKNYQGFKYSICTAVNEESVHGIPRKNKILRDGDIISVDCGVRYPVGSKDAMCTDAARTFCVGDVADDVRELVKITEQCFDVAINGLKSGDKVKTIGERIEKFIDGRYGIVNTYFGHGISQKVHDDPLIPNFDVEKSGNDKLIKIGEVEFKEGQIICIEPMINLGNRDLITAKDGWTAITRDGKCAAHHENTLIVWENRVEVVT